MYGHCIEQQRNGGIPPVAIDTRHWGLLRFLAISLVLEPDFLQGHPRFENPSHPCCVVSESA